MKTKVKRMSKRSISILLSILMLLSCMAVGTITADAGTSTTVYYIVPASVVGSYTVKCNTNHKGDGDDWHQYNMTDTGNTSQGKKVYSCTFTDTYNGLGKLQFQLYNGNTFQSQQQPISSWTDVSTYNGKAYTHDVAGWNTLTYDTALTTPSITLGGESSSLTTGSGDTATLHFTNWSSFSDAATTNLYTLKLYNGSEQVGSNITANDTTFTITKKGSYTVKCEPTETGVSSYYKASTSNTITVSLQYTVYFKDTKSWGSAPYVYLYTSNTLSGKGAGGQGKGGNPPATLNAGQMTSVGNNIYSITFTDADYKMIIFNRYNQNNYKNFWSTTVAYEKDFDTQAVDTGNFMFTPGNTNDSYNGVDYYKGTWSTAVYTGLSTDIKGSVDGSTYETTISGSTATISATSAVADTSVNVSAPNISGWQFVTWYSANGTFGNATTQDTTFTPNANNASAVARYKRLYQFSGTSSGNGSGTLTVPSGTVAAGNNFSIDVSASKGSTLTAFTVNGVDRLSSVSSGSYSATASFGTTSTINVAAEFTLNKYNISYSGNNVTYAGTNPTTNINYGTQVNFTVNPYTGYVMDAPTGSYVDHDTGLSTPLTITGSNGNYSFTMPDGPVTITANAAKAQYIGTISSLGNGTVSPSGQQNIDANTGISVTATPDAYYEFDEWVLSSHVTQSGTDSVNSTTGAHTATFMADTDNVTIDAKFKEIMRTVTATSSNTSYGTVSPASASVGIATSQTFTATPITGYKFVKWTVTSGTIVVGGTDYSTNSELNTASITVNAKSDASLVATFEPYTHQITASGVHATITPTSTTAVTGDTVNFTVSANKGYTLSSVTATMTGSTITVSGTGSTRTITIPAVNNSNAISVTATATAIKPKIRLVYNNAESTTDTQTTSNANISNLKTSSRKSETISFNNASSYPNNMTFKIYDGDDTALLTSTAGGTTSTSPTLAAGTHTLKVRITLDSVDIDSYTISLTVYQARAVTVQSPKYGGTTIMTYTNDFGVASQEVNPALNSQSTVNVANSQSVTIQKGTGGDNDSILHRVKVDGVDVSNILTATSYSYSVSSNCTISSEFRSKYKLMGFAANNWTYSTNTCYFVYTDTENVLECKKELTAGLYGANYSNGNVTNANNDTGFKVYNNSSWYGSNSAFLDECTDWQLSTGTNNAGMKATENGAYIFRFNKSNNKISVELPRILHNISYSGDTNITYTNKPVNSYNKDTVTINATAKAGYYIKSITVMAGSDAVSVTTNNYASWSFVMPTSDVTVTFVTMPQWSVKYYVDLHSTTHAGTLSMAVVGSNSVSAPPLKDSSGNDCVASVSLGTLTQQGSSTVYAGTINTPVTQTGVMYSNVYLKISYNSKTYVTTIDGSDVKDKLATNKEVWLEAANESSLKATATSSENNTPTVAEGDRRIYLAKPYSWQTSETNTWGSIGIYYWGSNPTDIGWTNSIHMNYIGYDSTGDNGYHYYYADIPKKISQNNVDYVVDNIIFQGWGADTVTSISSNSDIKAKTGNIEGIGSTANFFVLSKSGSSYAGTRKTPNAVIPGYTDYYSSAEMNVTDSGINIAPIDYTGASVTYSSSNSSYVTVDSNGNLTPVKSTKDLQDDMVNVTVNIYGSIGDAVKPVTADNADKKTYNVSVKIHDPEIFEGFNIMSFESQTSTIELKPESGNDEPGYINEISTIVSGVNNIAAGSSDGYTTSAVIEPVTAKQLTTTGYTNKYSAYTVKYAKPQSSGAYSNIQITADVQTKSIAREGDRYGHSYWKVNNVRNDSMVAQKTVNSSVETSTTKNITLADNTTYSSIFVTYKYVEVTFNFHYYDYNTTRYVVNRDEDGNRIDLNGNKLGNNDPSVYVAKEYYQYDKDYVGPETIGATGWNEIPSTVSNDFSRTVPGGNTAVTTHISRNYTPNKYEIRGKTATGANDTTAITSSNIITETAKALKNMPTNSYYNYDFSSSNITISNTNAAACTAVVDVNLVHTPKQYTVYLNGTQQRVTENNTSRDFYYQEYADLSVNSDSNWQEADDSGDPIANSPTLATGKSYKFRVTENIRLATSAATTSSNPLEEAQKSVRSEVKHSGSEIVHEPKKGQETAQNPQIVEKLIQNFYIADFFDPAKVLDPGSGKTSNGVTTYIPYDNASFVGGGVMYYSMSNGSPNEAVVNNGYVNGNDGTAKIDKLKQFIKSRILENKPDSDFTDDVDLANSIAYGTEIEAQVYKINNRSTGLVYRYLPLSEYKRDSQGELEKDENDAYTLSVELNSNTFRYSNALKAYQYIYASKEENKETNNGKNMRLYAYYVYSYTKYDADTGIPYTEYEVVVSDHYAEASTYWANPKT